VSRRRSRREKDNPESTLSGIVHRNIKAVIDVRRRAERAKPFRDRLADVLMHALIYCLWVLWNTGVIPNRHWFDPFPFVLLANVASIEAIFLTAFVLMSQKRMSMLADQRSDLDLQINLLSEHEVTRLIQLTEAIAKHLHVAEETMPELDELKQEVRPEVVLNVIESASQHPESGTPPTK
jgi:uncharacterized membrane protein